MMTEIYKKQLNYIFNRPITDPVWYWTNDDWEAGIFDESPMSSFVFIETLLSRVKTDLTPYSDAQIGMGLTYIFNDSCSNLAADFKAAAVPFERKIKAIDSLFNVFEAIFNPRCAPVLSAFSQVPLSKIQYICYMFWDVCSWSIWTNQEESESPVLEKKQAEIACYKAIANVMKRCLDLINPACVESGLHGLGHLAFSQPNIAAPIIENYLKNAKNQQKTLMEYAEMAKTGMIP